MPSPTPRPWWSRTAATILSFTPSGYCPPLRATSHGTHVALTALRRHPKSIGRAILAGVEGPNDTFKLPSMVQRHLEDIDAIVPGFLALVEEVLDRYEKQPQKVEVTDPTTGAKVQVEVNDFTLRFYTAANIGSSVIGDLPKIYEAAKRGEVEGLAAWWLKTTREPLGNAMSYTMDCASGSTSARLEQIQAEAPRTLLWTLFDYAFPDVCASWNVPDLGDAFRQPVRFDGPLLLISGTLDARTPISNAEALRTGAPRTTHLILEGGVHGDALFVSTPAILETMQAFLREERLPATIRVEVAAPVLSRVP